MQLKIKESMLHRLIFIFTLLSIKGFAQVQLKDSNLPIVVINTLIDTIRDEPAVKAQMGIIDNGKGKRNALTDVFNNYDGKVMIEYRGQTSQELSPKKPYRIELIDENGEEVEQSIMGMPKESDWVLIAPYSDKTLMRDALTYHIGSLIMPYAPRFRFCELVVNNQYKGVFMMTEKIKRDKDRVAIEKIGVDDIAGDELTGGYIIKWDKGKAGEVRFLSNYKAGSRYQEFFIEYPNTADIRQDQINYIAQYIREFEASLASSNFLDPMKGYKKYIDVDNFVDYSLINELTFNVDAQRLSTYFYKDKDSKDGRLKAGPLWDYNLAFGNANYCNYDDYRGWVKDFNQRCPGDYWAMPFWWDRFFLDNSFKQKLVVRWQQLRLDELSDANLDKYIEQFKTELNEAQIRNFQQWNILNQWVWPNANVAGSWNGEIALLKSWIKKRTQWIDNQMKILPVENTVNEDFDSLKIYPNPTDDFINFEFDSNESEKITIEIFDVVGKHIALLENNIGENSENILTLSNIPNSGIYFYKIIKNGKLVKQGKFLKM